MTKEAIDTKGKSTDCEKNCNISGGSFSQHIKEHFYKLIIQRPITKNKIGEKMRTADRKENTQRFFKHMKRNSALAIMEEMKIRTTFTALAKNQF